MSCPNCGCNRLHLDICMDDGWEWESWFCLQCEWRWDENWKDYTHLLEEEE